MMRRFLLYALSVGFVTGWWGLAFWQTARPPLQQYSFNECPALPKVYQQLSPLNRKVIHQALLGDYTLMGKLIADWELDAHLLEQSEQHEMKHLSRSDFLQSQLLVRKLASSSISNAQDKYFPQTYIAASFLLALLHPSQIVALPSGLREHSHLFPQELTQQIREDSSLTHSEALYLNPPKLAFVAPYSNPSFVEALHHQAIPTCLVPATNQPEEIIQLARGIGHAVDEPEKAELLSLFLESAMNNLDNHLAALKQHSKNASLPPILVVKAQSGYTLPTLKTLTGQLLARMQLNPTDNTTEWNLPISREAILRQDPYALIISTLDPIAEKNQLNEDPALAGLSAVQSNRVYFIDETVQQCASQHLVLAYYDLFTAVQAAHPVF